MARKLTPLQKRWGDFYMEHWNATQAAEDAGYKGNRKTLAQIGYENMRKPVIQAYIEERLEASAMGANETLSRLGDMARSFDIAEYIELKPRYTIVEKEGKHYKELAGYVVAYDLERLQDDGLSHLIKSIKQTNRGVTIEWHDQMAALAHLGKHHKLFTDKLDITTQDLSKGYSEVSPDDWDEDSK